MKIIPQYILEGNYILLFPSPYLSPRIDSSRVSRNINRNEKRIGTKRVEQAARWRISMKIQRGLKRRVDSSVVADKSRGAIRFNKIPYIYSESSKSLYETESKSATPRNIESGAYDVNVVRFRSRGPSAIHIPREQYTIEKQNIRS